MAEYFAHESAIIDQPVEIGAGTKIWHFSHVMAGARIGRQCVLGQNVHVASGVVLGDNVKVQNNVSIYTGVTVEDDVFLGPSAVLTNVVTPRSHVSRRHEFQPTLLRRGATVGANATVVCGVTIGRFAFVGAGAVVTRDVADFALVYGNPARLRGWVCSCGVPLSLPPIGDPRAAVCSACGRRYQFTGQTVIQVDGAEPGGEQ